MNSSQTPVKPQSLSRCSVSTEGTTLATWPTSMCRMRGSALSDRLGSRRLSRSSSSVATSTSTTNKIRSLVSPSSMDRVGLAQSAATKKVTTTTAMVIREATTSTTVGQANTAATSIQTTTSRAVVATCQALTSNTQGISRTSTDVKSRCRTIRS